MRREWRPAWRSPPWFWAFPPHRRTGGRAIAPFGRVPSASRHRNIGVAISVRRARTDRRITRSPTVRTSTPRRFTAFTAMGRSSATDMLPLLRRSVRGLSSAKPPVPGSLREPRATGNDAGKPAPLGAQPSAERHSVAHTRSASPVDARAESEEHPRAGPGGRLDAAIEVSECVRTLQIRRQHRE